MLIRPRSTGLLLAAALLGLGGCGQDDDSNGSPTSDPSTAVPTATPEPTQDNSGILAHIVPSDRRDVKLVIGYPDDNRSPIMGTSGDGAPDGPLVDLMNEAMDLLSLTGTYQVVEPGNEIDMLEAGDLHVYLIPGSNVADILDRVNAVTFLDEEEKFLVREGLEIGDEPRDLCGLRVGYYNAGSLGAEELPALQEFSAACSGPYGLEPIELQEYTAETGFPTDAVISGEVDAAPTGSFYGEWLASQHPGLSVAGPVIGEDSPAFLVGKDTGIVNPLADAIDEMVANGTYKQIMDEHGVPNMPPKPARVNPED